MLGNPTRSSRGMVLLVGFVFFFLAFVGLVYNHLESWQVPVRPKSKPTAGSAATVVHDTAAASQTATHGSASSPVTSNNHDQLRRFYLKELYKPSIAPDSPIFKPRDAFEWNLSEKPYWQQPMRENLCIIDLDNRNFTQAGEIYGPGVMAWDNSDGVHGLSLGLLNHYIYARIHGYRYYYIDIKDPLDRRASWKKPSVISKILKDHDVCIYLDSDAIFNYLDLPFEWLLNFWKLYPDNNSMALAIDPELDHNRDRFGKLYLNTGFIVSQNNPMTHKIMDDWRRCPDDDGPYSGCDQFRFSPPGLPTDQGGFGTFVRYNYSEHIRELPCTEANGFPQSDSNCEGTFIRHLWTGKDDQIKLDVGQQIPGPFLQAFHEQYLKEKPTFYIEEDDLLAHGPLAALENRTAS